MDWIEVTARTVDEAKELALDRLGVVEDELEFEVVDEARKGLFGIARSDARIRARIKPLSREKPNDRKRRRRPNERSSRGRGQGGNDRGGSRAAKQPPRNSSDRPATPASGGTDTVSTSNGGAAVSQGASDSSRRRRRGGRGRGSQQTRERPAASAVGADENDGKVEVEVETVPVAEQAAHAAKFADELVRTMGFNASVRTEIDGEDVTVHIDGEGLGALVGPRGATIQALEEVVRAAVQHFAGGHSAWMHVDVAGYRERRRQALVEFAHKIAGEVKDTGEERAMEPMTAADRKVVHDAIGEIDGVETTSEGEEPRRRVVVLPA